MHTNRRNSCRVAARNFATTPLLAAPLCLSLALLAAPAAAQTEPWRQTILGYLMAAGMDGTVAVGPVSSDVNVSYADLLDHLTCIHGRARSVGHRR